MIREITNNKKTMQWVLKALCKDKARPNLAYLYVSDFGVCCTDARRMHKVDDLWELEHGSYSVVTNTKASIVLKLATPGDCGRFPYVAMVGGRAGSWDSVSFTSPSRKGSLAKLYAGESLGRAHHTIAIASGACVNSDLLKDAVIDAPFAFTHFWYQTDMSPQHFEGEGGALAVLMPLRD